MLQTNFCWSFKCFKKKNDHFRKKMGDTEDQL